jgi:type IV pilus assembly protein PilF
MYEPVVQSAVRAVEDCGDGRAFCVEGFFCSCFQSTHAGRARGEWFVKKLFCIALMALAGIVHAEDVRKSSAFFKEPASPRELAMVHTKLGAEYFAQGNLVVAMDELARAIQMDEKYPEAWSTRALVYMEMKEFENAQSDFQKALRIAKDNPNVLNNYGWFLCRTGKFQEGLKEVLKAARDPLYTTPGLAYMNAGYCSVELNDLERAEQYLRQAANTMESPKLDIQWARLFLKAGVLDRARMHIDKALKSMEPPTALALELGYHVATAMKDDVAAGAFLRQLENRYPLSEEYRKSKADFSNRTP